MVMINNNITRFNSNPGSNSKFSQRRSDISFQGNMASKIIDTVSKSVNYTFSTLPKKIGYSVGSNGVLGSLLRNSAVQKTAALMGGVAFYNSVANPARDIYQMVLYVNADLKNKKLPPENRKYQAAFDLVNGITTFILTLAVGFTASSERSVEAITKAITKNLNPEKLQEILNSDTMKKLKIKEMLDKVVNKYKEKHANAVKDFSESELHYLVTRNTIKAGIKGSIGVIVATLIAKRILSLFISVPISSSMKDKLFGDTKKSKNAKAKDNKDAVVNMDNTKIAINQSLNIPGVAITSKAAVNVFAKFGNYRNPN